MEADYKRNIKPGNEYDHLFPVPDFNDTTLVKDGNVDQTVREMAKYIRKYQADTAKLAPILKGKTMLETLENDWDFVYNHIQYKLDKPGLEQLRRPARAWAERQVGCDCDCFSIFLASLLLNQKITPVIRVVQIAPATSFHHVYPIVQTKDGYYVLDCVLNKFNDEKPFTKNKDFTMSGLGIPIVGLSGIDAPEVSDVDILLSGTGFAGEDDRLQYLISTRNIVQQNPAAFSMIDDPNQFIADLTYAIDNWNTPQRDQILEALSAKETLMGLGNTDILDEMDDDQFEAWESILQGTGDSFTGVVNGDDLGAVLAKKATRFNSRAAMLKRKIAHPQVSAAAKNKAAKKLAVVDRISRNVNELRTKVNPQDREALAKEIRRTYLPAKKVKETTPKAFIQPTDYPGFGPDEFNNMQSEGYEYPPEVMEEVNNEQAYFEEPYDEYIEQAQEYIDEIENDEDLLNEMDYEELEGLGFAGLGAFWHNKAKRQELKQKRVEKRLAKAEKKGQTKKVENLKKTLEKIGMKREGTWKENRKAWRKENNRNFWSGIKNVAKNLLTKLNPAVLMIRGGFLLALRMNIKKMSSRLRWGYATKEQALKAGISEDQFNRSVDALKKVKKLFADKMGGREDVLRKAIINGSKKDLKKKGQTIEGLGELGMGPVVAGIAAAASVIAKVVDILKKAGLFKGKDANGQPSEEAGAADVENFEQVLKSGNIDQITSDADVAEEEVDKFDIDLPEEEPGNNNRIWKIVGFSALGLGILGLAGWLVFRPRTPKPHTKPPVNGLTGTKTKHRKTLRTITLT